MARKHAEKVAANAEHATGCCGEDCCGSGAGCCGPSLSGCCKVEAVVAVDARGQMVLPKELRDRAGIRADDKLAVVAWEKDGAVCCLSLLKADDLAGAVRSALGPMIHELVRP